MIILKIKLTKTSYNLMQRRVVMTQPIEVRIADCLSDRQKIIYYLKTSKKLSHQEIADYLGISPNSVKRQIRRIRQKLDKFEEYNTNVIQEIFEEEVTRTKTQKFTVSQAQFLSEKTHMSSKEKDHRRSRTSDYEMRKKTKEVVTRWKASNEELRAANQRPIKTDALHAVMGLKDDVRKLVCNIEMNYRAGNGNNEVMASYEIVLRAYGIIHLTPYINKLNAKTSKALRANAEGYNVTIVKPEERASLPQGSKHIETIKNDEGDTDYSIFLVPAYISKKKNDSNATPTKIEPASNS